MKNTLENKAAFFAQYWGMNILRFSPDPNYLRKVSAMTIRCPEDFVAILTPLSQISDKDLKAIGFGNIGNKKLHFVFDDYDTHWKSSCGNWGTLLFKDFDHLRSKGYALPWMGITVEEQIKLGWIKLKDNE